MKKSIALVLVVYLLFTPSPLKTDASLKNDLFHQFSRALHDKDFSKLNSLIEPHVKIPEIRENTPLSGLSTMSSPQPNTYIMIGSFREEDCGGCLCECERTAFIWEVTKKGNKISAIKVLSDLANPLMNEQFLIKEYKAKFKKEPLVPSYFPFKVTHADGIVTGEKITVSYKNRSKHGTLEIKAVPTNSPQISTIKKGYASLKLKDEKDGLIMKTTNGYEISFIHDGMEYKVKLYGANNQYKPSKTEIIKTINSMIPDNY